MFGWIKQRLALGWLRGQLARLEKEGQLEALKAFFGGSKKATAMLAGILAVVLGTGLGLDPGLVEKIVQMVMAYLGAQGIVDVALAMKGAK